MTPTVRRATPFDLEVVAPLFDAYRQFYGRPPELDAVRAFLRERFERDESVIFMAEFAGRGVGFTQLYPSFTSVGMNRIWVLNDLFVAADARRLGVGRMLMDAAQAFAESTGATRIELSTAHANANAQALYESCGYQLDTEFRKYERNLRYSRSLTP